MSNNLQYAAYGGHITVLEDRSGWPQSIAVCSLTGCIGRGRTPPDALSDLAAQIRLLRKREREAALEAALEEASEQTRAALEAALEDGRD